MKLSLAVQTPEVEPVVPVALLRGPFDEKLAKAAQWGAQGIELMATDPARLSADDVRAALSRSGLEAAAIGTGAVSMATGLSLLHGDADVAARAGARLRALTDFAAAVGAPLVTIGSFRGRLAWAGEGGEEQLIRALREGAAYAAARGVRLALEPLNRYVNDVIHTVKEALAFIEAVGHEALGVLIDTFHLNIEENSWTEPFREAAAAGLLWHVHVSDNNRLAPGWGLIDFAAIVAALREIGYSGYLSAELLAQPDGDAAAQQTLSHMRALV